MKICVMGCNAGVDKPEIYVYKTVGTDKLGLSLVLLPFLLLLAHKAGSKTSFLPSFVHTKEK